MLRPTQIREEKMKIQSYSICFTLVLVLFVITNNVNAQSNSVFLNLELGQTTYKEALRQVTSSMYGNNYHVKDGSIFITTSVMQNDGTNWDYVDLHFENNNVLINIQFSSVSNNHNTEYIISKYSQVKEKMKNDSSYVFWYTEKTEEYYEYKGDCVALELFDSSVAGKVVRVQYIDL